MNGIRWIKSHAKPVFKQKIPNYRAKIGHLELWCRPYIKDSCNGKFNIIGWTCSIYFENESIDFIIQGKSLKFVQEKAEKSAVKYLFGDGFITLKALKKMGLLEELLSEVGVDL